ncbi:MAG: M20 family metallopeptidase [Acidobacteria bacterium]|nr:M20 family metallopeptidase [Acidobacteriota bacterium]
MRTHLAFCEAALPWAVETIEALVCLESPSGDKAAVDACGREVARLLRQLGGSVGVLPGETAGDHLLAEFGSGRRQVLVMGHIDTVWPVGELERRPLRREGDMLFGPGVFDMKAGIVLAMLAIRALQDSASGLPGRVMLLLTSDEETGSATSRSIIEDEARRSEAVLVLEPPLPGGALKTARKGCGEFHLRVTGKPAHAGIEPERGVSAIRELARQILAIESLQDPARGTTLSVGIVRGGTRGNVIPAEAEAIIDVRAATPDDADRVTRAMQALRPQIPGAAISVTGGIDRPPFERTPAVEALFRQAQEVAANLGRTLGEGSTGGGSDGNLTAALNVPTIDGLGAIGAGAHGFDEHVDIPEVPWRAALIAGLIERILSRLP